MKNKVMMPTSKINHWQYFLFWGWSAPPNRRASCWAGEFLTGSVLLWTLRFPLGRDSRPPPPVHSTTPETQYAVFFSHHNRPPPAWFIHERGARWMPELPNLLEECVDRLPHDALTRKQSLPVIVSSCSSSGVTRAPWCPAGVIVGPAVMNLDISRFTYL